MFETQVCSKKQIKENKSRYILFFILVVTKVLKFKGAKKTFSHMISYDLDDKDKKLQHK